MNNIVKGMAGAAAVAGVASGVYTYAHKPVSNSHAPSAVGVGGFVAAAGTGLAVLHLGGGVYANVLASADADAGSTMFRRAGYSGIIAAAGVGILVGGLAGWVANAARD